jgi:hypothetical protein
MTKWTKHNLTAILSKSLLHRMLCWDSAAETINWHVLNAVLNQKKPRSSFIKFRILRLLTLSYRCISKHQYVEPSGSPLTEKNIFFPVYHLEILHLLWVLQILQVAGTRSAASSLTWEVKTTRGILQPITWRSCALLRIGPATRRIIFGGIDLVLNIGLFAM